jgi:hypothetical protein
VPVLVSDPYQDPRWGTEHLYPTAAELAAVAMRLDPQGRPATYGCYVIADDPGDDPKAWRRDAGTLARGHRHHGHALLLLMHHWADVPPVARSMIDRVVMMPQALESAEQAAKRFGVPELAIAGDRHALALGEALVVDVSGATDVRKVRLW